MSKIQLRDRLEYVPKIEKLDNTPVYDGNLRSPRTYIPIANVSGRLQGGSLGDLTIPIPIRTITISGSLNNIPMWSS